MSVDRVRAVDWQDFFFRFTGTVTMALYKFNNNLLVQSQESVINLQHSFSLCTLEFWFVYIRGRRFVNVLEIALQKQSEDAQVFHTNSSRTRRWGDSGVKPARRAFTEQALCKRLNNQTVVFHTLGHSVFNAIHAQLASYANNRCINT